MRSFLQLVAQRFAREQSEEYTFVFPNRRAGLFFRKYYGMAQQRPVLAPEIMTINDCFHSLSDLRILDQLELTIRLYRIYVSLFSSKEKAEPLEKFLHWGQMMLADFSEIDNHLVPYVKDLLTTIRDWQQLNQPADYLTEKQLNAIRQFWGEVLKPQKNNSTERFTRTWDLLYPCYQQLRESLLKDGCAYEGLLHRQVIENWHSIPEIRFRKHYVFIGFNALTVSEEKLLLLLQEKGIADFYFDYHSPLLRDPLNRASLFKQHNEQLFHSRFQIYDDTEPNEQELPAITCISIPSDIGETHQVYRILDELYPANDSQPTLPDYTRTAVVLPDETLLIPLLHSLPEQIDKINVTMGYPMRATREFVPIRQAVTSQQTLTTEEAVQQLRQEWTEAETSENSEIIFRLQSLLNRIEDLCMPGLDVNAFYQILHLLASNATIPYTGEPLNGLQVMGVLETRALDFDNLIITGFNDELYPGRSQGNSFIPYTLRKGFGLPTPERQDAIFAYNFYRMLSYAKRVWLITNSQADDQHTGEASRYLQQLQYQFHIPIRFQTVILGQTSQDSIEPTLTDKSLSHPSKPQKPLSPSALSTFLRCKRKYFYQYVMRLKEERNEADGVDDMTLGSVVHATIAHLYNPYLGKTVNAEIIENIQSSLAQQWNTLPTLEPIKNDPIALAVARYYIDNLLEKDKLQPFTYLYSEKTVTGTITVDNTPVSLVGVIDRVDIVNDYVRLIDYKTGHTVTEFNDLQQVFETDECSNALQTLYYCYLAKQSHLVSEQQLLQPHIFKLRQMSANRDTESLVHPKKGDKDTFTYQSVEKEVKTHLSELVKNIYSSTDFPRTDSPRKCESCGFADICK